MDVQNSWVTTNQMFMKVEEPHIIVWFFNHIVEEPHSYNGYTTYPL